MPNVKPLSRPSLWPQRRCQVPAFDESMTQPGLLEEASEPPTVPGTGRAAITPCRPLPLLERVRLAIALWWQR
jgi:hypothetical protein